MGSGHRPPGIAPASAGSGRSQRPPPPDPRSGGNATPPALPLSCGGTPSRGLPGPPETPRLPREPRGGDGTGWAGGFPDTGMGPGTPRTPRTLQPGALRCCRIGRSGPWGAPRCPPPCSPHGGAGSGSGRDAEPRRAGLVLPRQAASPARRGALGAAGPPPVRGCGGTWGGPGVTHPVSPTPCHTSAVTHPLSPTLCHPPRVTHPLSPPGVTHPASPIRCPPPACPRWWHQPPRPLPGDPHAVSGFVPTSPLSPSLGSPGWRPLGGDAGFGDTPVSPLSLGTSRCHPCPWGHPGVTRCPWVGSGLSAPQVPVAAAAAGLAQPGGHGTGEGVGGR